jgi:hypothetical protein
MLASIESTELMQAALLEGRKALPLCLPNPPVGLLEHEAYLDLAPYLTQVATYRTPTIEIVANVAKSAFAD